MRLYDYDQKDWVVDLTEEQIDDLEYDKAIEKMKSIVHNYKKLRTACNSLQKENKRYFEEYIRPKAQALIDQEKYRIVYRPVFENTYSSDRKENEISKDVFIVEQRILNRNYFYKEDEDLTEWSEIARCNTEKEAEKTINLLQKYPQYKND